MTILFLSIDEVKRKFQSGEVTVSVHGLGKLGLPLAVIYANAGARVIGVDYSPEIVDALNQGTPINTAEPQVNDLINQLVSQNKLSATTNGIEAAQVADISVIVVPILIDDDLKPDFSFLASSAKDIGKGLKRGNVVILESTAPPGTTEDFLRPILENESGLNVSRDFGLAYSPERVYIGRIIADVVDRYPKLVGGIDRKSEEVIAAIYEVIAHKGVIRLGSTRAAEITKVFEGIYRDVNIALANEMAWICEKLDIDPRLVVKFTPDKKADQWFLTDFLKVGFQDECLPKDLSAFLTFCVNDLHSKTEILEAAKKINKRVISKLKRTNKKISHSKD